MVIKLVALWIAMNILIVVTLFVLEAVGAVRQRLSRKWPAAPDQPGVPELPRFGAQPRVSPRQDAVGITGRR